MKSTFFLIVLFWITNCKAQFHSKLEYTYIGISFYPTNCIDSLDFTIEKGEFINCEAKIFLEDCSGQCKFIIIDNKKVTRVTGYYANSVDTLSRYSNAKVLGKLKGHSYYQVRILKYLSPLQTGIWIFYNKKGKEMYRTEYHFERQTDEIQL